MLNTPYAFDDKKVITRDENGDAVSYIFDDKWNFSEQESGTVLSSPIVSFQRVDKDYRKDIQKTLACIMDNFKNKNRESAGYRKVESWKQGLVLIRNNLKCSDWASLSDDKVYSKFERNLKLHVQSNNLSETSVARVIRAMNQLNECGFCMRIPDGKKLRRFSTKGIKQAIAIPIGMYQALLTKALETVEHYHSYRYQINDLQQKVDDIYTREMSNPHSSNTLSAVTYRVKRSIAPYLVSVPNYIPSREATDLTDIMSACLTITLAFSGMRLGEVSSISKYSYQEKGIKKIPVLIGEESKRNGVPIKEAWQTHPIVKDALELIYDATQHLRDKYRKKNAHDYETGVITEKVYKQKEKQINSAFLVTRPILKQSNYAKTNMQSLLCQYINKLGITATKADVEEFNRLNPSREGEMTAGAPLPKLTPHDFRRSFAVFFKRYGFGSNATIKFQYKHRNINMSGYYSNNAHLQAMEDILLDNELLGLLNEEGVQMGVEALNEIYNESENLSGLGGERILKDKFQKLSSGEIIYMTRSEIETHVRNGTLSVVKLPTGGYCLNPSCSRVCGVGEFQAEIKPCEHQVITDKGAKNLLKQNQRLIQTFRKLNTGDPLMNSILIATKQKIKRNEVLIRKHNLKFATFSDVVKGSIITKAL